MSINQLYDYAEGGFRIFPLWGMVSGKCECHDDECSNPGKHPRVSSWQNSPFNDDEQLDAMSQYLVTTGFGVCLDAHLVLDIDPRNNGDKSFDKLCTDLGIDLRKESQFIVETGGGGWHIYFKVPADQKLMAHHKDYPGVDFKNGTSGGSFVVGGGSLHASGAEYTFEKGHPQDVDYAPDALLDMLQKREVRNKSLDGVEVSNREIKDALEHLSPDASRDEWVSYGMAIHDATNGEGIYLWDEWSAKGSKYRGFEDIERCWHSFGKSTNPIRIGTLFRDAENAGYIRPVTFDHDPQFDATQSDSVDHDDSAPDDIDEVDAPKPKHVKMLEALLASDDAEMLRVANMQWLIDGLIPAESFGVVFGEPGCGKSFTMVDMACSVASGEQWQGIDTGDEGIVVYISAEGGNGMRFRKRAWEQKHRKAPLMRVLPMTTIMDDPKDVGQLVQVLREYKKRIKQPIKMIVVDTLNRSMMGNENDNSDMADFVRGCEKLQHEHKCGVVVVHHSGKDAERGARGASALKAATDFEVMVGKKDDMITVTHTRAKDVEPLPPVICRAEVVVIEGYLDYKSREITSLVPMAANFGDEMRAASMMSERETLLLDIVKREALAAGSADMSCDKAQVRESFGDELGVSGGALAQALSKNLKLLRDRGMVEYDRNEIKYTAF